MPFYTHSHPRVVPVVAKREEGEVLGGKIGQLWGEGAHHVIVADVEDRESGAIVNVPAPELGPRGRYGASEVIVLESHFLHV